MTCGSRASSSRCSTAPTTWASSCGRSDPGPDDGSVCCSTTWSTGHPYVDVWAAVKPSVIGLRAWPEVPKGENWKDGVCRRIGVSDPRAFWKKLLGSVNSYADLEPPLVGAVERLIDFVTEPS